MTNKDKQKEASVVAKKSTSSSWKVQAKSQGYKARDSDERKEAIRHKIELKRLLTLMNKAKDTLEGRDQEKLPEPEINKNYRLKGAARAAQEFYMPPDYKPKEPPRNLLVEYQGKLWEVPEGRNYLRAMVEYARALYSIGEKPRDAVQLFQETMVLDQGDHLRAKEEILRCYLNIEDAVNARQIIDQYGAESSSLFAFTLAFIEFISYSLKEAGSSKEMCDELLSKAIAKNPYIAWMFVYHDTFEQAMEQIDDLETNDQYNALILSGSIEEACLAFKYDLEMWQETEGSLEWLYNFLVDRDIDPPSVEPPLLTSLEPKSLDSTSSDQQQPSEDQLSEIHHMYVGMFLTGLEMVEENLLTTSSS